MQINAVNIIRSISWWSKLLLIVVCLFLKAAESSAQSVKGQRVEFVETDSGLMIKYYYQDACKSLSEKYELISLKQKVSPVLRQAEQAVPALSIQGNIGYNFLYNSLLDTPFAEQNLRQHIVQTNLHFLIKNKYPLRVTISNRQSNSAYFEDATNVNLQFNQQYLLENIKRNLRDSLGGFVGTVQLQKAEEVLRQKTDSVAAMKAWLKNPLHQQQLVEEKEHILEKVQEYKQERFRKNAINENAGDNLLENADKFSFFQKASFNKKVQKPALDKGDSLKKSTQAYRDTLLTELPGNIDFKSDDLLKKILTRQDSVLHKKFEEKRKRVDKLQEEIRTSAADLNRIKKNVQDSVNLVKKEINSIRNSKDLNSFMSRYDKDEVKISNAEKLLLAVRNFSLGRTWLDYSELTMKNLSVNGFNLEVNPGSFYFAAAAGKVNYRFRDFVVKNDRQSANQGLYLLRGGLGKKDGNNVILTYYDGKKMKLNTGLGSTEYTERIIGMSVEARYALDDNNHITAEIARSSFQNSSRAERGSDLVGKIFNLKHNNNTAYSIRLSGNYPLTNTKLTALYRKMGQDFNSFTLYPGNINQEAYAVRVSQSLWKRRLSIDAAIRKNDFNNQFTGTDYTSSAVFKSLQLTFRQKKMPFVSIGFYPTSQLFMTDNNVLMENQYNTLNAVTSYSYHVNNTGMNSSAMMTKFYNNSSDSGFIYFNASNYSFTQSFYLGRFTVQAAIFYVSQQQLKMTTVEPTLSYQYKNIFSVTGGFRWNRLSGGEDLFGGAAGCNLQVKKIGSLQLNYDKTYIPGRGAFLRPVNIGRVGFYRDF